jgi:hypothetical protein
MEKVGFGVYYFNVIMGLRVQNAGLTENVCSKFVVASQEILYLLK